MLASCLNGEKFTKIKVSNEEVIFYGEDEQPKFMMHHEQDCCETVYITEATLNGIDVLDQEIDVGEIIVKLAKENEPDLPAVEEYDESYLWTVYEIETNFGLLKIVWYGTSNGCYGEAPSIARMTEGEWSSWE